MLLLSIEAGALGAPAGGMTNRNIQLLIGVCLGIAIAAIPFRLVHMNAILAAICFGAGSIVATLCAVLLFLKFRQQRGG